MTALNSTSVPLVPRHRMSRYCLFPTLVRLAATLWRGFALVAGAAHLHGPAPSLPGPSGSCADAIPAPERTPVTTSSTHLKSLATEDGIAVDSNVEARC